MAGVSGAGFIRNDRADHANGADWLPGFVNSQARLATGQLAHTFPHRGTLGASSHPVYVEPGPPAVHRTLGDLPRPDWANDLDQLAFMGSPLIEEICFFHRESRTVILGDLIQTHPKVQGNLLRNAIFRLEGVAAPHGGVGLDIRLTFTNRDAARRSLDKLLSWDFDKLIIAHGACVEKNAKAFVEHAFRWLIPLSDPSTSRRKSRSDQ